MAVAVIREGVRPSLPEAKDNLSLAETPNGFLRLMEDCWQKSPYLRPKFLEVMNRLEALNTDGDSYSVASSRQTTTSDASNDTDPSNRFFINGLTITHSLPEYCI